MDENARELLLIGIWNCVKGTEATLSELQTNLAGKDAPLTVPEITEAALRAKREEYAHRALVSWDQLTAAMFGVENDQTISSQTEIDAHKKIWYDAWAKALNDGLDLLQKSHGQLAQVGDIVRDEKDIATNKAALSAETGLSEAQVQTAVDAAAPTQK